jgi:hypothetical protein
MGCSPAAKLHDRQAIHQGRGRDGQVKAEGRGARIKTWVRWVRSTSTGAHASARKWRCDGPTRGTPPTIIGDESERGPGDSFGGTPYDSASHWRQALGRSRRRCQHNLTPATLTRYERPRVLKAVWFTN